MENIKRRIWLENAIEDYIKKNPNCDTVDITSNFKGLRVDITLDSLSFLVDDNKVIRKHLIGINYGYVHL